MISNAQFSFIRNGIEIKDPTLDKSREIKVDPYYTYGEHQTMYVEAYINGIFISLTAEEFNDILMSMRRKEDGQNRE